MTKILTVCLGNICRSPMAEGIIANEATKQEIDFEIDSCGTAAWHEGNKPDNRARQYMNNKGISIDHLRARQITTNDLEYFDHILVMDSSNLKDVLAICKNEVQKNKVKLMLSYWPNSPKTEVPDPYYGGEEGFEEVFYLVENAAKNFIKSIQ